MISGLISVFLGIVGIALALDGEWGAVAICAVLALFVLCLGAESRKCDRAYVNRVDYWEKGGPNARAGKSEAVRTVKCAPERPERKAVQAKTAARPRESLFVCPTCGRYVKSAWSAVESPQGVAGREYYCPRCRKRIVSGI